MLGTVMFVILGYLSGSVLYARVFSHVFRKEGMLEQSRDGNPGTANAFLYGGFWCGFLTLLGDLLKGFLPVFLFWHADMPEGPHLFWNGLVIAAPVIGHAFPLFYGGRGGKGIAVTFGCLLGLLPLWRRWRCSFCSFLWCCGSRPIITGRWRHICAPFAPSCTRRRAEPWNWDFC